MSIETTIPQQPGEGTSSIGSGPGKTAEIRLLGQRVYVKCTDADPDVTAEAVELVTGRIENAENRASKGKLPPHQVVLLALLDLAEEYVQAKRRTARYQAELESRIQSLLSALAGKEPVAPENGTSA